MVITLLLLYIINMNIYIYIFSSLLFNIIPLVKHIAKKSSKIIKNNLEVLRNLFSFQVEFSFPKNKSQQKTQNNK